MDDPVVGSIDSTLGDALSGGATPPAEPVSTPVAAPAVPAAPAAPVAPAATTTPAITSPSQPGPTVDPLVERLKAAGVAEGDIDQVRRYYDGHTANKEVVPPAPVDHYSAVADELLAGIDPEKRLEHEQYRAQYGDKAYVAAVYQQEPEEPVEPDPVDYNDPAVFKKAVADEVRAALAPYAPTLAQTDADAKKAMLKRDLDPILEALQVPAHVREFLSQNVEREIQRAARENRGRTPLRTIVDECWASVGSLLGAESKATEARLRAGTTPLVAPPLAPVPPAALETDTKDMKTVDARLDSVFEAARLASPPEGSA